MRVAGAEVLVAETIRRLCGRIEATVFCLDQVGELGEDLITQGVPVICLNRRPGRDWRVAWRLAGHLRNRGVELIHAHQYTPFFYAALAKLASGRWPKLVLTEQGRNHPDVVSRARRLSNRFVLDHLADAVTGVCEFSLRGLCEVDCFARGRMRVIENGIDLSRYGAEPDRSGLRVSLGLDLARRYLITVARFHPVKDHETLLGAFRQVAQGRPDVDLLLVGDGDRRGMLEEMVRHFGLSGRVHFLGVRPEVPDLLRAADVFVLTSKSEAASISLMEAMATSLPVVATDVGGNPELVQNGRTGLLVPRGDTAATASALLWLLDHPAEAAAMGAAGRARVEEKYRLDRTIDAYLDLYRGLTRSAGDA
jgi:glycosyltransferase involved in cell wall biosynthesis